MKHADIDINDIELDTTNPRIQQALEMYDSGSITADHISLALKEGDGEASSLNKLRESIQTCGKIIHPIVVDHSNGRYRCIEGNTRLQIYRDFVVDGVSGDWSRIPCLVYEDTPKKEIDAIRLQAHLVGPRQWTPYAKAKYIFTLWDVEHLTRNEIVKYCGGNESEIKRQIAAFTLFEDVYKANFPNYNIKNFSAFVEFQQSRINFIVAEHDYKPIDFCTWIDKGRFSRLEHVRNLPEILGHDESHSVFLAKNSSEALKILNQPSHEDIAEKLSLEDILDIVTKKIIVLSEEEKEMFKENPTDICSRLNSANGAISDLLADLS